MRLQCPRQRTFWTPSISGLLANANVFGGLPIHKEEGGGWAVSDKVHVSKQHCILLEAAAQQLIMACISIFKQKKTKTCSHICNLRIDDYFIIFMQYLFSAQKHEHSHLLFYLKLTIKLWYIFFCFTEHLLTLEGFDSHTDIQWLFISNDRKMLCYVYYEKSA